MKTIFLYMYLLSHDGSIEVPPKPVDNVSFTSITQCETYKKRMGYSEVGNSRLRFVCKAK